MDTNEIPTSELFADLQVSLTEIFLIEQFGLNDEYQDRLIGNKKVLASIQSIMEDRFWKDEIIGFLENGFPRKVDLNTNNRLGE